jgi:hypothetical protein
MDLLVADETANRVEGLTALGEIAGEPVNGHAVLGQRILTAIVYLQVLVCVKARIFKPELNETFFLDRRVFLN